MEHGAEEGEPVHGEWAAILCQWVQHILANGARGGSVDEREGERGVPTGIKCRPLCVQDLGFQ